MKTSAVVLLAAALVVGGGANLVWAEDLGFQDLVATEAPSTGYEACGTVASLTYTEMFAYELTLGLKDSRATMLSDATSVTYAWIPAIQAARALPQDVDYPAYDPVQGHMSYDLEQIRPWGRDHSLAEAARYHGIEAVTVTTRGQGGARGLFPMTVPLEGGSRMVLFIEATDARGRRHVVRNGRGADSAVDLGPVTKRGPALRMVTRARYDENDALGAVLTDLVTAGQRPRRLAKAALGFVSDSTGFDFVRDVRRVELLVNVDGSSPVVVIDAPADLARLARGLYELPPSTGRVGGYVLYAAVVFRSGGVWTFERHVPGSHVCDDEGATVRDEAGAQPFGRLDREALRHRCWPVGTVD